MDIIWSAFGYTSATAVATKYPEEVKVINDFLINKSADCKYKPGCGGVNKLNDRRIKKLLRQVRLSNAVTNAIENNNLNNSIRMLLNEKMIEKINKNETGNYIQVEILGGGQLIIPVPALDIQK